MKRSSLYILCVIVIIAIVVGVFTASVATEAQNIENATLAARERDWTVKESAYQYQLHKLQEENRVLLQTISDQQAKIESLKFKPLDIPLSIELQACAFGLSSMHGVDFEDLMLIGMHETGMVWHDEVMDANGKPSIGFMMLNQPTWDYLSSKGIDVHTEMGNIHGGIYLFSELHQKAESKEQALIFYECGIRGGQGLKSTQFSRWVLERKGTLKHL